MTRYFPIAIGVMLIVGLTVIHARMSDRFADSNVSAEQRAELLKLVPMSFGDWSGEDKPVDPLVKQKAGSEGIAVSRSYRNSRTGERVDLWLICGHAREISAHTPDVCYPGAGFEARAKENGQFPFTLNGKQTPFLTNTFFKEDVTGRHLVRVFWTWFNSESGEHAGDVVWEAPQGARYHFANSRALFKMYFTSEMRDTLETPEQSACIHFARDFMPEVNKALQGVYDTDKKGDASPAAAGDEATGEAGAAEGPAADSGSAPVAAGEPSATNNESKSEVK
jgi:hypothetical protein